MIGIILLLNYTDLGKYYKITKFDIDATIHSDGSMTVTEITDYKFSHEYNGITITLPEKIDSNYYDSHYYVKGQNISNSLYNNSSISDVNISLVTNSGEQKFTYVEKATLGDSGVYTISRNGGYITYKIYQPSCNEKRTFKITYTLHDVVVKHLDSAEVFWNFVGGNVECSISNLNIRVNVDGLFTPDNTIGVSHGNATGSYKFKGSTFTSHFSHVSPGEFVGVRLAFPNELVSKSNKQSNLYGLPLITEFEEYLDKMSDIRKSLNIFALFASILLIIYWIFLYKKYEKERVIFWEPDDELKLLEKYNPMIAACIAQDRGMHPRDIIAVLINLVNKKVLDMDVKQEFVNIDEKLYYLEKNKHFFENIDNINQLDQIEKLIVEMFFENDSKIELASYTKAMAKNESKINKIKLLDKQVAVTLSKLGANKETMPKSLRIFHTIVFILVCVFIIGIIAFNLYLKDINLFNLSISYLYLIFLLLPMMFGIIFVILKILNFFIVLIKKGIRKLVYKFSNKDLMVTAAEIIGLSLVVFLLLAVISGETYVLSVTFLFAVSLLIIKTDNLMTKHSRTILKDYFLLKSIQNKIETSALNDRTIESQLVWDKYLTFSIALGYTLVDEYSKDLTFMEGFDTLLDSLADTFLELAYIERDFHTIQRINSFGKFTGNLFKIYGKAAISSRGIGSSSGGSSFGGGGFSGGGGGGGGRGAF